MKFVACFVLALLLPWSVVAQGADLKSGPQPGDAPDAFQVTKLAGAGNDNVEIGQKLCYRCMLGDRPVVMVFAHQRALSRELADLIQALDKTVAENGDKKLASFVNLLGNDPSVLRQAADAIVEAKSLKNIPIVMPEENVKGPESYKLNPKAAVTVLVYRDSKVQSSFAFGDGKLDKNGIEKVVKDTKKMLD